MADNSKSFQEALPALSLQANQALEQLRTAVAADDVAAATTQLQDVIVRITALYTVLTADIDSRRAAGTITLAEADRQKQLFADQYVHEAGVLTARVAHWIDQHNHA